MHPGRLAELDLICIAPLLSQPEMNAESLEGSFFLKKVFFFTALFFCVQEMQQPIDFKGQLSDVADLIMIV